jgi:type 1 glutamine amidotransferase
MAEQDDRRVRLAVVTGGHGFDVTNFHRLFRRFVEVDAYVQHLEEFAGASQEVRDAYHAVLFYFMPTQDPTSDRRDRHAAHPLAALEHLGQSEQGLVVLHHALLAYRDWPLWGRIVGLADRSFEYFGGQTLRVEPADADHPITRGLGPWTMIDETYTLGEPGADSTPLLTTDHPHSMSTLAWTRTHGRSRVFCLECGHDNAAWMDHNFREVLRRGILWSARRI